MNAILENLEKSISERIDEILAKLSKDQIRFVVALQEYPSKKDAAEAIGIKPNTAYSWRGEIEEVARLMAQERLEAAKALRKRALVKAIMVKIAGLDSEDEDVRQKVATEIIEWELGKAGQKMDLTTAGQPIQPNVIEVIEHVSDSDIGKLPPEPDGEIGKLPPT